MVLLLEKPEDVLLHGDDLRHRQLRFHYQQKDYVWPFEIEDNNLNIAILCKIGDLLHASSHGYRFAIFADGLVVCLSDHQREGFSQLLGYDVEWLDNGGPSAFTKAQTD